MRSACWPRCNTAMRPIDRQTNAVVRGRNTTPGNRNARGHPGSRLRRDPGYERRGSICFASVRSWPKAAIASSLPSTQCTRRIETSRRAGLDPPIEMNRLLRIRQTDKLSDLAACEAIVDQLAGQDPPYGSGYSTKALGFSAQPTSGRSSASVRADTSQ